MKTIGIITIFILMCSIGMSQNKIRDPVRQLDSLREVILTPKLKQYDQDVEGLTAQINATHDKKRIKVYAKEIAKLSNRFEDDIAVLYDYAYQRGLRGGFSMGIGAGPWIYPGMGGWMYPGGYYPGGYSYAYLPPIYYDVDHIKRYANNMRMFSGSRNVRREVGNIEKRVEGFKKM
jgi:hypothetical protein